MLTLSKQVSPLTAVAPGDLLTYTLTVGNVGSSNASAVQVVDAVPANTVFDAIVSSGNGSGSFDTVNNRVLFNPRTASGVDRLDAGDSETLSFRVRVVGTLPQGSTPIPNTATASAANAPSVSDSVSSSALASPGLTLDKQGPATVSFPATTLATTASASSTVRVLDASRLAIGDTVRIGGSIRQITAIAGQTVTLDGAVSAAAGDPVQLGFTYTLTYANRGNATATGVTLGDTLPANLVYAGASPTPATAPAVGSNGSLSFSIGSLAPGALGVAQVRVVPLQAGSYTNNAVLSATDVPNVIDTVTTQVGGLIVDKRTTTPLRAAGDIATYVLRVRNTLSSSVSGIVVTDVLPPGFSYLATESATVNGSATAVTSPPGAGSASPSWGSFTLPGNGTLEITFTSTIGVDVGPATYDNEVSATNTSGIAVAPFDHLATDVDDVTVLAAGTGLVEGVIYRDNDGNGAFDPLIDTPLPFTQLLITDSNNVVYQLASDSTGAFRRVVPAGTTLVDVSDGSLPAGLAPTVGIDGLDPNTVEVPAGASARDDNGFVVSAAAVGTVSGRVWNDGDGNQLQNGSETGRLGVLVELRDAVTNALIQRTFTDLLGDYFFANVPPGDYRVDISPPVGTTLTTGNDPAPVSVVANTNSTADFGLIAGATSNADLSILKTNGLSQVATGVPTVYSLTVANAGPATVSNALIWDPQATGLAKTAVSCGSPSGGAVCPSAPSVADLEAGILAIPSLPPGSSLVLSVTADVLASSGNVSNLAVVSAPQGISDPNQSNNTSSDTDPVVGSVNADLAISKSNGVSTLTSGSSTTYVVVVSNNGPSAANGATVSDPAVTGLAKTAVSCSAASNGASCPGAPSVAALEAGTLAIPALPSGGSITLQVTATVTAAGGSSVTNTASVAPPAGVTDPVPGNNSDDDTDSVVAGTLPSADLSISKDNGVSGLSVGGTTSYTVVVSNAGPDAADGASVSDPAVSGLSKTAVSCTGSSGGAVCPASPDVASLEAGTLVIPTLPNGGSVTLRIDATVTAAGGSSVSNTALVSVPGGVTDPNPNNNTDSDTDPVSGPLNADLSISKNNGVTSLTSGSSTTYVVVISNGGPSSADGATVSDPAVAGLSKTAVACVDASNGASCPVAPSVADIEAGTLAIPALPTGGSVTLEVTATVSAAAGSTVTNTVTVSPPSGITDPVPGNNSADDTDSVVAGSQPSADLSISKDNGVSSLSVGGSTSYTLLVSNAGPNAADGASVSDPAVSGLSKTAVLCTGSTGGAVCPASPDVASLEAGTLAIPTFPVGGTLTLRVDASVTAAGGSAVTNIAEVSVPSGLTDPDSNNNTSSDTDPVLGPTDADLSISKNNGVTSLTSGSSTTYVVVISNGGPSAADGATVSDPAVAGLSKTAVACVGASNGASCPGAPSVADIEAGTLAIPVLPIGGSVTLEVTATVSAAAGSTVTNSVSVSPPSGITDPVPGNNSADDTDSVVAGSQPSADLSISKDNGVSSLSVGGSTSYTLLVSNAGPNAADGASVSDPAVSGLSKTAVLCTGSTGGAVCPTSPDVASLEAGTLAIPTFPVGGTLTLRVDAAVTAAANSAVTNIAEVSVPSGLTDPDSNNNTSSDTDPVSAAPVPGLSLLKQAALDDVVIANGLAEAGERISYTLTATNTGGTPLSGVSINDPLLPTLSCVQPVALAPGERLICTGSLLVDQARVDAGAAILNTATARGTPPSGPELIDNDDASVPVSDVARLGVAKGLVSVAELGSGAYRVVYELRARNYGQVSLDALQLRDDLAATFPTPVQFSVLGVQVTAGSGQPDPTYDGRTRTSLLQSAAVLAPGAELALRLELEVRPGTATGPFLNRATVSGQRVSGGPTLEDDSVNGTSPDPDNNGVPDEISPTPLSFGAAPPGVREIPSTGGLALVLMAMSLMMLGLRRARRARVRGDSD
ncbi:hypothetical protein M0G41_07120 [Lysobacter sp. CAU 1642]|uniref:Uncharacterized protein n=1 Tax=Pseudomarimonas salicorniae TaxID=2933270 RepID=A0ABT0GFW9_9GAMM|nr:hypothetical protein [Lysobacter sp. CAU 1642]